VEILIPAGKFSFSQEDRSLLEALERQGVVLEYQCRQGYCGACRTQLLAGKVDYPSPPLAFTGLGEILPCCCRPASDLVLRLPEQE